MSYSVTEACAPARPISPIEDAHIRNQAITNSIHDRISALNQRLAPVLDHNGSEVAAGGIGAESKVTKTASPLHAELVAHGDALSDILTRIEILIGRLAV